MCIRDRNYTVLVTTSLMPVAEAGKVLSTVLPLAAALIFAFSMSAAWLFSEWFTKLPSSVSMNFGSSVNPKESTKCAVLSPFSCNTTISLLSRIHI